MNAKGSAIVLFLCFLSLFTLTGCSTCQKNILEGKNLPFKLADRLLKDDEKFTIKKDDKLLVRKQNINQNKQWKMVNTNLELQQVNLSNSGKYTVDVFDEDGKNLNSYTETVCVYVKVPKPRVNVTCQDKKVYLTCEVEDRKDISFSWEKNKKESQEKGKVLTLAKAGNSKYACTAQNPVHNNTSDEVEAACTTSQQTLFGFDFTLMVGILAGGGFLVLLLITVMVTLACRSCKRKEKHLRDEEEFRLNYVSSNPPPHKGKQTARGQPAPPEPVENGSAEDLSQAPHQVASRPRAQQREASTPYQKPQ
ncbi:hypothetical protein KOW79_011167 [Hemibagrus wyckioides]|uniref:Ig-like domain-containing protein n=1 Tax=Hemibagrus wyckioides TaxID=337641 RepID=A0A9D3NJS5_9TELE|nr:hypothetical protein KOW79_011167 [Hemibagrus wyckioides]